MIATSGCGTKLSISPLTTASTGRPPEAAIVRQPRQTPASVADLLPGIRDESFGGIERVDAHGIVGAQMASETRQSRIRYRATRLAVGRRAIRGTARDRPAPSPHERLVGDTRCPQITLGG